MRVHDRDVLKESRQGFYIHNSFDWAWTNTPSGEENAQRSFSREADETGRFDSWLRGGCSGREQPVKDTETRKWGLRGRLEVVWLSLPPPYRMMPGGMVGGRYSSRWLQIAKGL